MSSELPRAFGPYVLLKSLGSGAMGDVHLARPFDPERGIPSPVVIKRLHGELHQRSDFVERFRHEAELAVRVDSPHVAKVYDVGAIGETMYIAMEYVAGWPLAKILRDHQDSKEPPTLESVIDVIAGAAAGLAALHTVTDAAGRPLGVVHRDISPRNLMLGEDGVTKVIDLGLGKSNLQSWKTATGVVMGSVGYMPPEQVAATGVDHRSDLYALGVILFELLTLEDYIRRGSIGVRLHYSLSPVFRPPSAIRKDLPTGLDAVVKKAVEIDPDDRFQSAGDFLRALRAVVPAREERARTLIGEFMFGELSTAGQEVKQLLSLTLPRREDSISSTVFVQRPGIAPEHQLEPTVVREGSSLPDETKTRPVSRPTSFPQVRPLNAPSSISRPSGRARAGVMFAAAIALLFAGIAIDRVLLAPLPEARSLAAPELPPPPPSIRAVPGVAPAGPQPQAPALPASEPAMPQTDPRPSAQPIKRKKPPAVAAPQVSAPTPTPSVPVAAPSPAPVDHVTAVSRDEENAARDKLYRRIVKLHRDIAKNTPEHDRAKSLLERFSSNPEDPKLAADVTSLEEARNAR